MSEATTIFICGVCGRTDRWNPFTGKTHWSKGERCGGKPIAVEYVPAARIAELERLLAERDQALRWMATEWAKYAEDTVLEPSPELVDSGVSMALEAAAVSEKDAP